MNYKSLLIVMFSIVAFSCVEKSPTLLGPDDDEKEEVVEDGIIDLPQGVHWRKEIAVFEFEPEEAVSWNYETRGLIIIPNDVKKLDGIKSGDVLVAWDTYIFFVDKLVNTDAGIEVSVRRFSVADAIYGEFDIPFFPANEEASIGNIEWPKISTDIRKFGPLQTKLGSGSKVDAGLDFPVTVEGQFKGKIPNVSGYSCEGKTIKGYCVDYLLAKLTLGVDANIDVTLVIEGSLEFGFDEGLDIPAVKAFNRRVPRIALGSSGLAIQPQLEIPGSMKVTASAEATLEFQAQASGRLPLGFEYFNQGYNGRANAAFEWIPNVRHPVTFEKSYTTTVSKKGKVVVHQHIGVGIGFRIVPVATDRVGISGVGFAGRINEDITYDPYKPNNCLQSHFFFDASAKAQIKFFVDPWGPGEWEWELLGRTGSSNDDPNRVTDGTIPIGKPITLLKSESGTEFCLDEGEAKQLRLTVVDADEPPGLEDGQGYELDGVQVTRITNGTSSTWNATSASGGGNASAATGAPDAKTCSSYSDKVAAVTSTISLTFNRSFKDGDVVNIFQYLPGNEIGQLGACYGSGTVSLEVGNGSTWNKVAGSLEGGVVTIQGSDLSF